MKETRKLAFAGVLSALAVVLLIIEAFIPTGKLGFYALASFVIIIVLIECNLKYAVLSYSVSSILAFILSPEKSAVIPYVIFFGVYGIVKYLTEKMKKRVLEYSIKITFFNFSIVFAYLLIKEFLIENLTFPINWIFILIIAEIVFVIYDYLLTLLIGYYYRVLKGRFNI